MKKKSHRTSPTSKARVKYPWLAHYPPGIDWHTQFKSEPLGDILDRSADNYGDRICTYFLGKTETYSEIRALANRAAKGLQTLGAGKGTKVALLLPNCPAFVVFYYGILKTGASVVNCNPLYTVEELDHQIKDSEAEFLVTLDLAMLFGKADALLERGNLKTAIICHFAEMLPPVKSFLFTLLKSKQLADINSARKPDKIVFARDMLDNDGAYTRVKINPKRDIAVLQYTGGTTGTPKGAMLTHANLTINIQQVNIWATNLSDDGETILGVLPLFHVFAMTTVLNFGVARGFKMVLVPKFDLDEVLGLFRKTRPTIFPGVPTIYNALLHHPKTKPADLSSLKFCIAGGAALPAGIKRGFEALSGCSLVEGYGLSETSPVATCNPVEGVLAQGSIGIPLPATIIAIRSLDKPEQEMPIGEDGEICIAGPQVMPGYWKKPKETKDTFTGKFFRTGDIGHMDKNGYIFIVDRIKDMINCSGFKVYPRHIEDAIYQHEAVEEVTVIGVPDDYRGEAPAAYIKLRQGHSASAEDILAFLKPKISKIEMPRDIEFRDQLPKTMIGKLSKKELREEADAN